MAKADASWYALVGSLIGTTAVLGWMLFEAYSDRATDRVVAEVPPPVYETYEGAFALPADLETVESLDVAMRVWGGAVLVPSTDGVRRFADPIAIDRACLAQGGDPYSTGAPLMRRGCSPGV